MQHATLMRMLQESAMRFLGKLLHPFDKFKARLIVIVGPGLPIKKLIARPPVLKFDPVTTGVSRRIDQPMSKVGIAIVVRADFRNHQATSIAYHAIANWKTLLQGIAIHDRTQ